MKAKQLLLQSLGLVVLAVTLGLARQFAPQGISWNGRWPGADTPAETAYKMMAKEGDPGFVALQDAMDLQQKKTATFLDARSREDFDKGRIPGARILPYYEIEKYQAEALKDLNAESPLVIYCEGIGCELSFFLGRDLQAAGYKNIKIFYGGYPEWQSAGLPIEK